MPIINDLSDEANETCSATLTNPFNAVLGTQTSQTVTITDNDPAPTITWQNSTVSANEAGGNAALTVQLSAPSSFSVGMQYATANGTATSGSDYTSTSGTLTFAPGETIKVVNVPLLNDTAAESNETFTVALSSPSNGTLGTPTSATVTLTDDDTAAGPSDVAVAYDRLGNRISVGTPTSYGTQSASCPAGSPA